MAIRHILSPALALLAMFAIGGLSGAVQAAEIRGSVSKVEAGGRVQINLPAGAAVQPGAEVRIETVVPGIGPVEIKTRWRVKLVGEGFVIAEPEGQASGTPQVGYSATIARATPATAEIGAPQAIPSLPSLRLTAEQLTELQKQAEGGDARAMMALGRYHQGSATSSDSVPRNLDEATRWYEKAAQAGDARAMTSLGVLYRSRRMDDAGAAWFRKAADKGNAFAMLALSQLYTEGRGVPKDEARALEWAKKAAESGDAIAAVDVAARYFSGRGTRQNFGEAAYWFRRAADKGNAAAMAALAQLYADGKGVAKDANQSFEWAMKAAQAGASWGAAQIGADYHLGSGAPVNAAEAKRWYEVAADNGDAEAMFGLSVLYANGLGVAADPRVAADWMIKALSAGSFQAAQSILRTPGKWNVDFRKELQKGLHEAGLYQGPIHGRLDVNTGRAIAALSQRALKQ